MQTYVRPNMVLTHGEGARLYDAYGKEYLDFAAGIAVNSLGRPCSQLMLCWPMSVAALLRRDAASSSCLALAVLQPLNSSA